MKMIPLFFLVLFILSGCAPSGEVKAPAIKLPDISQSDPSGKIIFSLGGEPSVINPILSTDTSSSAIEGVIFSGLIRINASLEVEPEVAISWRVSKDGTIWTFYLRRDVFWHDGKPLTAHDVKFTFDSILNPKVNSVRRSDYIIDGQQIQFGVINDYIFQAVLPKPFAPFLVQMGMGIIPKHLLEGKDINTADFNRNPIGSGPFKFVNWAAGDHLEVVRNDDYFLGKPLLENIIFKIIPDNNAAVLALEAEEVDTAGIPAKDYKRSLSFKDINVFTFDSMVYTYLGLNIDNPIFSDKRVRQALAYATNKQQLIGLIHKGLASPAYCPEAPISWAYSDDLPKYEYDPNKAEELLKEAGWKPIDLEGPRIKGDKKLEFTVLTNQGNKDREKAAIILQQQYKKIGVKMNIRVMEWSALLKIINDPTPPKEFDAVLMGWSLGVDPDSYSIWHSSQYPRGFNFIHYASAEVDRLLEEGRTTINRQKRKEIYAKLNYLIAEDQPYIFLWYPKAIAGVNKRVGGLSVPPGPAGLFLNIEKVFVAK